MINMPANAGTAYVQIVPSAKGIKGKITDALKGESQTAGESSGSTIGSALVSNLKSVITVGGIGAFLGASLTQGGSLQQSLGGVETLFKKMLILLKIMPVRHLKLLEYLRMST